MVGSLVVASVVEDSVSVVAACAEDGSVSDLGLQATDQRRVPQMAMDASNLATFLVNMKDGFRY